MSLRAFMSGVLLVGLILVGAGGVAWAAGVSYSENVPVQTYNGTEQVVQDIGNATAVGVPDAARSVYDNETVVNASGVTLTEGTDYEWWPSNEEIYWYNTSNTTDGANATITYWYDAKLEAGRSAKAIVDPVIDLALPAGILIVLGISIAGVAVGIRRLSTRSRNSPGR